MGIVLLNFWNLSLFLIDKETVTECLRETDLCHNQELKTKKTKKQVNKFVNKPRDLRSSNCLVPLGEMVVYVISNLEHIQESH